ncbi:MAG: arginine--tRNA ligase [Desulfobacterales bacterium]|nr:arginine--tRNA ligase [Desulfobacterales bacterium]
MYFYLKQEINNSILEAVKLAFEKKELKENIIPSIEIEEPKIALHGDFSTNIAMVMAKTQKMPPKKISEIIIKNICDKEKKFTKIEVAGAGFINFFINLSFWYPTLKKIHDYDIKFGSSNLGKGKKVLVEFVSANPTGPIHIGHGRGAAVGDTIARILSFSGYNVQKEYYINDSGKQINTLGYSTLLRYRELFGHSIDFPQDCYPADYIKDIALEIKNEKGDSLLYGDEKENIKYCASFSAKKILDAIRNDLNLFGIEYDNWYSEQSLYDTNKVQTTISYFRDKNIIYEKEGALWFKTSQFGDEKDRVVVRQNNEPTYFASDIAYHKDKFDRKFDKIINVWGADHHGYVDRLAASIEAAGHNKEDFRVVLINMVNLLRGGIPVAMGKRTGEFVTLRDVMDEVGTDAARFIFLTRHYESPLDFDLEIATKKNNDNPVFYVQYVHARISSILKKASEANIVWDENRVALLNTEEDVKIIKLLARFPEVVRIAAECMEPHRITFYLMELASSFHNYYNKHKVLSEDLTLSNTRLYLMITIKKVIRNGLSLLGVSAPEKM